MDYTRVAVNAAKKAGDYLVKNQGRYDIIKRDGPAIKIEQEIKSEKIILETIRSSYPDSKIVKPFSSLCEESGYSQSESKGLWIVDPLDGTKYYVDGDSVYPGKGNEWGVIVSYIEKEIEAGAIYLPKKKIMITAERGKGVRINNKEIISKQTGKSLKDAVVWYDPSSGNAKRVAIEHKKIYEPFVAETESVGCSASSFYNLLNGNIDILIEYRSTPWDDAAGVLAVRELGGKVTNLSGKEWFHNFKHNKHEESDGSKWFIETTNIAASLDPLLLDRFIEEIK